MFYFLCILCLSLRVVVNILIVWIGQYFMITLTLFPAVIKMDIGIIQITVIIEIIIRVQQCINTLEVLTAAQRKKASNLINNVIASRKRADRWVHLM